MPISPSPSRILDAALPVAGTSLAPVAPVSETFYPSHAAFAVSLRVSLTGNADGARLLVDRKDPAGVWYNAIDTAVVLGTDYETDTIEPLGGAALRVRIEPTDTDPTHNAGRVTADVSYRPVY